MGILLNKKTNIIVQGITGRDGAFHTQKMIDYCSNVVGGVTPGKGGTKICDRPVFNSVSEAKRAFPIDATAIFVPPRFAIDAIWEAIEENIKLIVVITEGLPAYEMLRIKSYTNGKGIHIIGPNCPGIVTVDEAKIGIMPGHIFKKGNIGIISRSGTLTYEVVWALTKEDMGQTTVIGIGGDAVIGSRYLDLLREFKDDDETKGIVLIGEIGGGDEIEAAKYVKTELNKPAVAFISGKTAPKGKKMGHAGAIVAGEADTAEAKINRLNELGVPVAELPQEIPGLLKNEIHY